MKTYPNAKDSFPLVPYRQLPLVLLLLTAAVLAVTWPWARIFSSAFLNHWDPPFHAWKLELVARSILSGHLLPPDGNTNMYYPHSGALFFEALHWPQALVAAALFGLTNASPVWVYHLVLVLFWALAGVCIWMLLLAMGSTRQAALLGALVFTIIPYRISYMVEFNMQLCFGIPLFFFFMVRFFQRPSIRYACGMALAWWLQATSELYQAVFLLLILPFPGFAMMVARWRLLGSFRRFWLPALCAAVLGGILSFVFLGPYLTMLNVHAVNRNLMEIATHVLEPLSYLRPGGRWHFLAPMDVRKDEMIVYPTFALILLAATHLVFDARRLARIPAPRWIWACRAIRWTALVLFAATTFFFYFHGEIPALRTFYSILPVVATLTAFLVLLHPEERDVPSLFATGLFAGSIFAFFMSMGPFLSIRHSNFAVDNVLYLWVYKHLSALQGFRVVSRFSIYLLLFMVVAAGLAWTRIQRRWLRRPLLRFLWILPVLAVAAESIPPGPYRFREVEYPVSSPVLDLLDQLESPHVVAMAPMGDRNHDSRHMLQIARTDRLFVYAWGGAYPDFTRDVRTAMDPRNPDPATAAALLRQLWPECVVLEDKRLTRRARIPCNYAEVFAAEANVAAEDFRFSLLRFKPQSSPSTEQIRLIRQDLLRANPLVRFRARTPAADPEATLWLDVNGYPVGRWEIAPASCEFSVEIPENHILPILPNRLRFHADNDKPFFLDAFAAAPAEAMPGLPAAEANNNASALSCPPWLGHRHDVPSSAIPLDIRYRNGFAILGCEPIVTSAPPGGVLYLRHYVRCPRDMQVAVNLHLHVRLRAPDGSWIEENIEMDRAADLNDVRCQIHPAIYALNHAFIVPERLVPGDYTLSLVLRNSKGKRIPGEQDGKNAKMFPVPIPIRILPPG